MNRFCCTVFNPETNRKEKISLYAQNKNEAALSCIEKNLPVIKIRRIKYSCRKKNEELLEFTRTIEEFIESGMTIKDSLESCKSIYSEMIMSYIKKGRTFSSAILEMKNEFPPFYLASLKTADEAGSIREIFPRLREYLELKKSIREKISAALVYPSVVLILMCTLLTGTVIYIIPKIKEIFSVFGDKGCEEIEKNISELEFLAGGFTATVLLFSAVFYFLKKASGRNRKIKEKTDLFLLKVPFAGKMIIEKETMNFAFAMETLSKGGIPVEKSIENSAGILCNLKIKNRILHITDELRNGSGIADSFKKSGIFSEYVCRQLEISEHSADSKSAFRKINLHFKNRIEKRIKFLMTLIEPAVIVLAGIGMIAVILKVIIPIFNLYGNF